MKKLVIPVIAAVLLLCSCSKAGVKTDKPPVLPAALSTDLDVVYNDYRLSAVWTMAKTGESKITVNYPESVAGLEMTFNGSGYGIKYKGMGIELDAGKFPQSSFGTALVNAFEYLTESISEVPVYKDGLWIYEGELPVGSFVLAQNGEDGTLKYFSVPSIGLTVNFLNFKIVG